MERIKWIERTFAFDFHEGYLPKILERLRGTEARMNVMVLALSEDHAGLQVDRKWSIKENIGHLCDLEELHSGRINDFILRKEVLRAADMSNEKTFTSNHNEKTIHQLIHEFSEKRDHFISRFGHLDDETLLLKALHPRLQIMMRPVDVAYFIAEHDDHHLTTIREILMALKLC